MCDTNGPSVPAWDGRAVLAFPAIWFAGPVLTCDYCGRTAVEGAETLAWTTAVERGVRKTFCDVCSREHLRAMEGKLDSEWW